ncbi:MAG: CRISPR-associated helicase Cas3' [Candidatus Hydrothermia bacterium]|jgi:CRISPR-associated endonuclease/helicase Cas3
MTQIWAKSKSITLSKHIEDVLSAFDKIKCKIPDDTIKKAIKIAIFYHDFGKVIPKFQISKVRNKNYEPFDIIYEIPHSLFSVFWIDEFIVKSILNNDEKLVKFVISAVAYHHWRESFDEFIRTNDKFKNFAKKVLNDWKNKFQQNLQNEIKNLNINDDDIFKLTNSIKLNEKKLEEIKNNLPFYHIAIPPYNFDYEILREILIKSFEEHKKWILISGFLQRCDHFASFCEEENENLDNIEIDSIGFDKIKENFKRKINQQDENKIWQIQKLNNEEIRNKNIILIAPTGYGKTEFAFLWSNSEKFIYTLPLRSAVNQIYERAKNIFGDEKVGLLHSDADVYLLEKEGDVGDTTKLYELSKALSFPAIISTGDQFFPYALRPPGYEKIFALFSYSRLIIDEVQAYDPKACAIIVSFIDWVVKMGGKFLLMSATMPYFVKKEIENRIGSQFEEINVYEEKKENFKKIYKHKLKIEVIENEDKKIDEIIDKAKKGKSVLVILNTVKEAQEIYKKLKEKADYSLKNKIFLIHSRFTLEDRRKKEVELIEKEFKNPKPENEGKILVATQVIEASLDINADVLFSEICPLDALIQRMGRVLRRYFDEKVIDETNVFIWVFKNGLESGKGNVYKKELLKLSLAWLWKKSQGEIDDVPEDELSDFFSQHFRRKNKKNQNILQKIIEDDEWVSNINNLEIKLSEYDKYKLVDNFYKSIPLDGKYLPEFYNTLEILSAGYMSNRKSEAQKIFREVYNVDVIIEGKLKEFKEEIKKITENKISFSEFKKNILMRYIISVPYFRNLNLNRKLTYEIDVDEKLLRWLEGIYIIKEKEYNEEIGLVLESNENESFII